MLDARPMAELWPMIRGVLEAGGCFRLWPRGRSMLPLLREGQDSVLLVSPTDIALYDIVLLRDADGRFLLHRVVALNEESVTLRGDALTTCEGPFPREAILARVDRIFREEQAYAPASPAMRRLYRRAAALRCLRRLYRRLRPNRF